MAARRVEDLNPEQAAKLKELGEDQGLLDRAWGSVKSWTWSDVGHGALDVVGFVPGWGEAADVANAAWYVGEAKYLDAGLSLISVIPVLGDVIGKGGKLATRLGPDAAKATLQALDKVDVLRFLDQFKTHPKLGPHVQKIQEAIRKWIDELAARGGSSPPLIGGRKPINSQYAGATYPPEKLPAAVRQKYPDSVRFTPDGFPDFSPYAIARPEIKFTGDYDLDFKAANAKAGLTETPKGYTWHHHQDGKTMQLVPTDLHQAVRHTGGMAVFLARGASGNAGY